MPTVSQQKIEARAYELWEQEGKPQGRDYDHWVQAASELTTPSKPKKSAAASNGSTRAKVQAPAPAKKTAVKKTATKTSSKK